jgi:hypothetical protein
LRVFARGPFYSQVEIKGTISKCYRFLKDHSVRLATTALPSVQRVWDGVGMIVGTLSSAASTEDVALGALLDQTKWSCGFDMEWSLCFHASEKMVPLFFAENRDGDLEFGQMVLSKWNYSNVHFGTP